MHRERSSLAEEIEAEARDLTRTARSSARRQHRSEVDVALEIDQLIVDGALPRKWLSWLAPIPHPRVSIPGAV